MNRDKKNVVSGTARRVAGGKLFLVRSCTITNTREGMLSYIHQTKVSALVRQLNRHV